MVSSLHLTRSLAGVELSLLTLAMPEACRQANWLHKEDRQATF